MLPPPEVHDVPPSPPDEHDVPPLPPPPENCCITYQRHTHPQINIQHLQKCVVIPKLKETVEFIFALSAATLEDLVAELSPQALGHLQDPPQ